MNPVNVESESESSSIKILLFLFSKGKKNFQVIIKILLTHVQERKRANKANKNIRLLKMTPYSSIFFLKSAQNQVGTTCKMLPCVFLFHNTVTLLGRVGVAVGGFLRHT